MELARAGLVVVELREVRGQPVEPLAAHALFFPRLLDVGGAARGDFIEQIVAVHEPRGGERFVLRGERVGLRGCGEFEAAQLGDGRAVAKLHVLGARTFAGLFRFGKKFVWLPEHLTRQRLDEPTVQVLFFL